MPTVRGWGALGAAGALGVLWTVFGEDELLAAAAFLAAAVVTGIVVSRVRLPAPVFERHVFPRRVPAGRPARVELEFEAEKWVRSAEVTDRIGDANLATFRIDRVTPGRPVVGVYELHGFRRGVYWIGPAAVQTRDPLGLAESRAAGKGSNRFVVYPRIEPLHGLPLIRFFDPTAAGARTRPSPLGGEDFFSLREYAPGDPIKRIHWPSTARTGQLMVRQFEPPSRPRALIVLDAGAAHFAAPEAFEHAVTGAASALNHLAESGFDPELWTAPAGAPVRIDAGLDDARESLAAVQTGPPLAARVLADHLRRSGQAGGLLVLVTGPRPDLFAGVYAQIADEFARVIVMLEGREAGAAGRSLRGDGAAVVASPAGSPWGPAWTRAMEETWFTAPLP